MSPSLDPAQQQVVDHDRGALLVTGGPGTGKTTALVERFARLVETGADPERLALVVRTSDDRWRVRTQLFERLGRSLPNLNVWTAHALANHVVGRRYADLGYSEPPQVLTHPEQHALVSELIRSDEGATAWKAYGGMRQLRGFADQVRNFLLRAQEALLSPDEIRERAKARGLKGWLELADFYREYLDVVGSGTRARVDFAGLLGQAAAAVEGKGTEPLFDHLMVDDYQDFTAAAESLVIGTGAESLVVAADPDAHIFSFQGYTDEPLHRFEKIVPTAARLTLDQRHRGSEAAVDAWTCDHPSDEAVAVARELRRIHSEGVGWSELAVVLRRQGSTFQVMLRALDDAGVPRVTTETWTSLTAEPAALPYVLALRWLAAVQAERDGMVEAMLTSELAGLSPASARGLVRAAVRSGKARAAAIAETQGLNPEESEALAVLCDVLERASVPADRSTSDAFAILWRDLPHSARLVAEAEAGRRRDLDAVLEFSRLISRASDSGDLSVSAFLASLGEGSDGPGFSADGHLGPDAVRVLTAHAAAGREFHTVVLAGCVEGDFPSLTRPERMFDLAVLDGPIPQAQRNRLRLEDERRLFRMVLARARERVALTASDSSAAEAVVSSRSRFADELGAGWTRVQPGPWEDVVSVAEASALWRHRLADLSAAAADRLSAIEGLLALGVDPGRWWFQRDWTDPDRGPRESFSTSFSRLGQLEGCELAYVLGQELGLGGRAGYHAWVGKTFHKLAEDCDNGLVKRDATALAAEAMKRWRPEEFPSLAVSEDFKRLVTDVMIPNWLAHFGGLPAVANEQGFSFEIEGATIRGFIDRISEMNSGEFRISDYKTGNAKDVTKGAESLQLGIYWLSTLEDPEMARFQPVRRAELAFVKGNYKNDYKEAAYPKPGDPPVEEWLAGMRERLTENVRRVRDLWNAGEYRPNTLANCFHCEFKAMCSLFPEGQPVLGEPADASVGSGGGDA